MRVRGPNNFGWAVQTDPTLLRYASAIMEQKKCWELLAQKFDRFQTLCSNSQQHATTCNRGCKRTQHVTSNKVGRCWPTMLRPFPPGFKRTFTCVSGHLGPGLPNSSIRIPTNFHLLALFRPRLHGENLSRVVPGRWVNHPAESTLASVYMRKHSCMLWLSNTALVWPSWTGWAKVFIYVYIWRKVVEGRRVTVTLLGEPTFCCSCEQSATFCKEIYEKLACPGQIG